MIHHIWKRESRLQSIVLSSRTVKHQLLSDNWQNIRPKTIVTTITNSKPMLSPIENLPPYVFGVKASGEVTADDLKTVLLPGLEELTEKNKEIYYILILETKVENFTAGAWIQDSIAGIKHLTQWKKMAIVTDQKAVENFTDAFSYITPGEAKGFSLEELDEAIAWVSLKS